MTDQKATPDKPMMRVCCDCHTIYGCYDGKITRDCALCGIVAICHHKFLYKKEPDLFPDTTHGICNVHFEFRMKKA